MSIKSFFEKLSKDYEFYEQERHEIIKTSSDILQKSKQTIFSLHRDDIKKAQELLIQTEELIKSLENKFKQNIKLRFEGSYKAAVEEYCEAKFFYQYMTQGKISEFENLELQSDEYLGAVADYTGELLRKAVLYATEKKFDKVKEIKTEMDSIMQELIQLNLTGYLRTKYDAAKRNLKKLEEILYDISLKSDN